MVKQSVINDNYKIPKLMAINYGWKYMSEEEAAEYMKSIDDLFGVCGFEPTISYGFVFEGGLEVYSILVSEEFPDSNKNYDIEIRLYSKGFHIIINGNEEEGFEDFTSVLTRLQEWLD